jgi:hypothetical protein
MAEARRLATAPPLPPRNTAPPAPRQSQAPSEPDFPDDLATHVVYDARPSSRPPPRSRVV